MSRRLCGSRGESGLRRRVPSGFNDFDEILLGLIKDLREDLLLLLVWVVTIGELSILQCTVNNTTTNTLIDKQQTKRSEGCTMSRVLMTRPNRGNGSRENLKKKKRNDKKRV